MEQKIIAAGILAICPETERFLLLKRRDDMVFPGYWNLPGGALDEGDGYPKITAVREFKEETGYKGVFKISKTPVYLYKTNQFDFYTYVGVLPCEFVPNLKGECTCGGENVDYTWAPLNYKWGYEEKIIPSVIEVLDLKTGILEKIINKFKNKNYE